MDPDNRRPVDWELRRQLLARIDGGWLPEFSREGSSAAQVDPEGATKLLVTAQALLLRRQRPELFGGYSGWLLHADAFDGNTDLTGRFDDLVPFGAGPGMCPGRNVVLLTSSLVLGELLRQHDFTAQEPLDTGQLPGTLSPFSSHFTVRHD